VVAIRFRRLGAARALAVPGSPGRNPLVAAQVTVLLAGPIRGAASCLPPPEAEVRGRGALGSAGEGPVVAIGLSGPAPIAALAEARRALWHPLVAAQVTVILAGPVRGAATGLSPPEASPGRVRAWLRGQCSVLGSVRDFRLRGGGAGL